MLLCVWASFPPPIPSWYLVWMQTTSFTVSFLFLFLVVTSCVPEDDINQTQIPEDDINQTQIPEDSEAAPSEKGTKSVPDTASDVNEGMKEDSSENEGNDVEICLQEDQCFNTFPVQIVDSTIDGRNLWDSYGCEYQTNESGPERLYKIVLKEPGFLAAEITEEGVDVDVDVHLLHENNNQKCIDRGHYAAGGYLEPGTYWIAVDTWTDENGMGYAGDFELSIHLNRPADFVKFGMKADLADDAMLAFRRAWERGDTKRLEYSVIDFSLHSSVKRQWTIHLSTAELLYSLHVAHGRASIKGEDLGYSTLFSNIPESHQSSLGMIKTAEAYTGDYGYSMRLDGLEVGFNDKVRARDIVVHPWNGSAQSVVEKEGWVVPTWGCAALDPDITSEVVDRLSGGSLMFFWSTEGDWRSQSTYLSLP